MKKRILTVLLAVFMVLNMVIPVFAENLMTIEDLEKEETAPKSVSLEELGNTFLTTVDINSTIAIRERIDELERQLRPIYEQEDYVKAGDQLLKEPAYYEMKELYERLKYLELMSSPPRKAKATMYLPTNNSTRYNYTHGMDGYGSSDYIYHMQMSDGRAVFCIELGKRANNGETYTESNFDAYGWHPTNKQVVKQLIQFAYNMESVRPNGSDGASAYINTQLGVWDIAHGQNASDYLLGSTGSYYLPYNSIANAAGYNQFIRDMRVIIKEYNNTPQWYVNDAHKDSPYYQYKGRKLTDIGTDIVLKRGQWVQLKDVNDAIYGYTWGGTVSGDRDKYDIKLEGTGGTANTSWNLLTIGAKNDTQLDTNHTIKYEKTSVINLAGKFVSLPNTNNSVLFTNTIPNHQKAIYSEGFPKNSIALNVKTIVNDPSKGIVKVIKKDKDTGELLGGAKFEVTNDKDSTVETLITKPNGEAESKEYDDGTKVTVKEVEAPGGYQIDDTSPRSVTIDYKTTPVVEMTFTDTKVADVGKIKIIKKDSKTGQLLGGAKYSVATDYSGQKNTFTLTTNGSGEAISSNLPVGTTFEITETTPPPGYSGKPSGFMETGSITAKDQVFEVIFENDPVVQEGSFRIVKVDGDSFAPLTGALFEIEINGIKRQEATNAQGVINWGSPIQEGTVVKIKELVAPQGYKLNSKEYTATIKAGQTIEVKVENFAEKGNIKMIKTYNGNWKNGEDKETGPFEGIDFGLYDSTGKLVAKEKSNSKGEVYFENQFLGTYTIRELTVPEGYNKMGDILVAIKTNGETVIVESSKSVNEVIRKEVKITKVDEETGKAVKVDGAEFKILNKASNKPVINPKTNDEIFKTDVFGVIELKDIMYGDYEIIEIKAPDNYIKSDKPIPFKIDGTEDLVEVKFKNNRAKGEVNLEKLGEIYTSKLSKDTKLGYEYTKLETEITHKLRDVEFTLYADEDINGKDGTRLFSKDEEVFRTKTDIDGKLTINNLEIGKYYIKEKKSPLGYKILKDNLKFEIKYKDDKTPIISETISDVKNELQNIDVKGIKKSDNGKPLKDVILGLYSEKDILLNASTIIPADTLLGVAETNKDGEYHFVDKVPEGEYYIQELKTVGNYSKDKTKFKFEYQATDNDDTKEIEIAKPIINTAQKHKIIIKKLGQVANDFEIEKTEYGDQYNFKFGYADLEGAEFQIFSKVDLYTADGTKQYSKDQEIETVKIGKGGIGETEKPLHVGEYYLRESKAPAGYKKLTTDINFEVKYLGQDIEIGETKLTVENDWQDIELRVFKEEERVLRWEKDKPVMEIIKSDDKVFGLYLDREMEFGGKKIPKDALLGTAKTKYGIAKFSKKVPITRMYIKEINSGDLHVLDERTHTIVYDPTTNYDIQKINVNNSGQDTNDNPQDTDSTPIINKLFKKDIKLIKLNEQIVKVTDDIFQLKHNKLGAEIEFELYSVVDEKETLIMTKKTDDKGVIVFEQLPIGKYFVKEKKLPEDSKYKTNLEKFEFEITKEDEVPKENTKDDSKNDVKDNALNPINNDTTNADTTEDNTNKNNGVDPKDIEKEKELQQDKINNMDNILNVDLNDYDIVVKNDLKKGKATIKKIDKQTKRGLDGAELSIQGKDLTTIIVTKATGNEMYLPAGKYTITEVKAPDGYKKGDINMEVEVKDGDEITIEVENEPINPLPQTSGRDILIYIVPAIFIGLIGYGLYKKKIKFNR